MKRPTRVFSPPVAETIGGDVELLVRSAYIDERQNTIATVEAWNGRLLHADCFPLSKDRPRKRFVNAVVAADSAVLATDVDATILRLAAGLPELVAATTEQPQPAAVDLEQLWSLARPLAESRDLLRRVESAFRALALVGERENALLAYLATVTRLFDKPVNVIVKGPSSGGKSHLLDKVLALLPASAFVNYTSVSARYLAYSDDDLRNRIVVLYEAGAISDGIGAYIVRSLLSEGRLDLGTVEKSSGGAIVARRLTKEGPTALFTSTTRATLDYELETRALPLAVTDTPEHSRKIIEAAATVAAGSGPAPPDLTAFHALQDWLALAGERRVVIPFAPALAELLPVRTVRIRRDATKLFSLISASAVLHQAQRERAPGGEVIADLDDYRIVRELLAESFAAAQQEGLTPAQREAVAAVAEIYDPSLPAAGVKLSEVAGKLGIDKSAASRRLANPLRLGYVINQESKKGRPAAYAPGEPLPDADSALPSVAAVDDAYTATQVGRRP